MQIAIISNSEAFFPLAYALSSQNIKPNIFYSLHAEAFTNQKVTAFTKQTGLAITEEKNTGADLYNWLLRGKYDVCFVIGYKHLIDLQRLKGVTTLLFNIHFGPLPLYRGPSPVFWQLKNGEDKLGLCIHRLTQKFDDGAVVWLKEINNQPHFNTESVNQLFNQLCVEGAFNILQLLINRIPLPEINRSEFKPRYQQKPELKDVLINWELMNSLQITNLIRACNPWNKGAITFFNGQEVKLLDANIIEPGVVDAKIPGTIINDTNELHIYCNNGSAICVNMLIYNDFYVPAYQCREYGFVKEQKFN
jgi:methionyl-tRNA formyltransferase